MGMTLQEIRDQVREDLDSSEEYWKDDTDFNNMINRAIRQAHRKIISIYEDYFLSSSVVSIAADVDTIDYPSDIFANKIKSIHFYDGASSTKFAKVNRFDETIMLDNHITNNTIYRKWLAIDTLTGGQKIKLYPKLGNAGTITIWYIREPKKLVNDDDVCDINEFYDYIIQLTKKIYYQEDADPRFTLEKQEALELEKEMIDTLTNMTVGNDDLIVQDMSHYCDSV
jgi:hypothetical protein